MNSSTKCLDVKYFKIMKAGKSGRNTLNKVFCAIKYYPLMSQHRQPAPLANKLAMLATPLQMNICSNPIYSHLQWIKLQNYEQLKKKL